MCTGATRMMQLGHVYYAAKDPAAGATHLLCEGRFMREVASAVTGPQNPDLEQAIVALVVEHRARTGHSRWRQEWQTYQPRAAAAGERLARDGVYQQWRLRAVEAPELYETLVTLCAEA